MVIKEIKPEKEKDLFNININIKNNYRNNTFLINPKKEEIKIENNLNNTNDMEIKKVKTNNYLRDNKKNEDNKEERINDNSKEVDNKKNDTSNINFSKLDNSVFKNSIRNKYKRKKKD